ncbi:glycoside hydrolase family 47 protein [Phialemonium atrogriseum]|uniref:alpha-1,2-Mannosidase n=1 Tax=Phialemonium atrogriseum TaxID=1093897 RepID=A0AAJ0BZ36_9PEZI|nr:glycoside hydrolase family 47 protein [Phialemonium atrogriseum]KAK1766502.1 glycoside hydrolase family 47 protein [Phialemonium atrogriseum]
MLRPFPRRRTASRLLLVAALIAIVVFLRRPLLLGYPASLPPRAPTRFKKSTFDWSTVEEHNPAGSLVPLPRGKPKEARRIQHDFDSRARNDPVSNARRVAVRNAFIRSWNSYKEHAWLRDELLPVTGAAKDTFGGWAATLVDSLDTLWIMDLKPDFYEAASAAGEIDWNNTTDTGVNVFETTIRHLGGLLSAYDLSGEMALLVKAKELGDMLYTAFDTPNRMPPFWLTFDHAKDGTQKAGTHDPSASPASLSLEFTRLAQLTGEDKYYDAIDRIRAFLVRTQGQSQLPGMWPTMINFRDEEVSDKHFCLGALADSLYEYLPKMHLLLGGLDESYEVMYRAAMDVVVEHVLFRPMLPNNEDLLFPGTATVQNDGVHIAPDGQHLACFVGGMFALGGRMFGIDDHVEIGERVARGCAWAYQAFPTGLMPELFSMIRCPSAAGCEWDEKKWISEGDPSLPKGFRNARDPRYILRPEAIESVFILYRITGKKELQDIAWTMFQHIMTATETPYANSAIKDVRVTGETEKEDSMESFWLSETLKYFYLIFSPPDVISLDEYVLNTEAHPFRRPK